MMPFCLTASLQIASTTIVCLMVVLSTCSTRECRLHMTENMRVRSVIFRSIDVKLCQTECFEDVFNFASCHRSNDVSKWIDETGRSSENHPSVSSGTCSDTYCQSNTRCEERRRGVAVCVEGHNISSALEVRCATYSDCPADRMFVCFTKTCKCDPGYSFNPASDSCVERCQRYGVGFTIYEELAITGYNNNRTDGKTIKECYEMCISETSITCNTFEYQQAYGVCQLSQYGYLDVSYFSRESGEKGWILAMRNCL